MSLMKVRFGLFMPLDKFEDHIEKVENLEAEGDDDFDDEYGDALSEDNGTDLFEKTLAYMRDNKIYSVGKLTI